MIPLGECVYDLSAFFVPKNEGIYVTHNEKTKVIMDRIRSEAPKKISEKMLLHLAVKEQERDLSQKIESLLEPTR
jgi:hypothetical protein